MGKKILVVEDNIEALEMMKKLISEIDRSVEIYTAVDLQGAYIEAMQVSMDVFLIDIVLEANSKGDVSGITFAEKIREIDKYAFTPIIFTTSLEDPKLYAFTNIHSFAYLEKPYSEEEAKQIIKKALRYTTNTEKGKNLYFRKAGILFSIKSSDIAYIESIHHKLYIQTVKERMELPYKTCKQIMKEADCSEFIQCNRSFIVNKDFIQSVDCINHYIILAESYGQVEIGATYVKKVMKELSGC